MHDMLKKMAKKSKGRDLSPAEVEAKSSVLKHLIGDMDEMMGDKLKGLKKVTVASDSEEGLEKGLDKAKEAVSKFGDIRNTDSEEELEEHQSNPSEQENEDEQLDEKDQDLEHAEKEDSDEDSEIKEKLKKLRALKEGK